MLNSKMNCFYFAVLCFLGAASVGCTWDSDLAIYTGEQCYAHSECLPYEEDCSGDSRVFRAFDDSQSAIDEARESFQVHDALGRGRCLAGYSCIELLEGGVKHQYCQIACPAGQEFCQTAGEYACVDTRTNGQHCGACGKACALGETCEAGACRAGCLEGQVLCGKGDARRCVDPMTDNQFCGALDPCEDSAAGEACKVGMLCSFGKCSATCAQPYTQCQLDGESYCANLELSRENCTQCGKVCSVEVLPSAAEVYCDGGCKIRACKEGHYLFENQCLANDILNCAMRGNDCTKLAGWALGTCSAQGVCEASACVKGYRLNKEKGICEAESRECCGDDCAKCAGNQVCSAGLCANFCGQGLMPCGEGQEARCVNINADPQNCMGCGIVCSAANVSHATSTYCKHACLAASCEVGYYLDNGLCKANDLSNCGYTGNACNVTNANNVCKDGKCRFSCVANYHALTDGSCAPNTQENCGAPGNDCSKLAGWVSGICSNTGQCVATACDTGYHLASGKCVADTNTCCGNGCVTCTGGTVCNSGSCQLTCTEPLKECNKACVNTAQNPAHCGQCNTQCNAASVSNATQFYCDEGACKASACAAGYFVHNGACVSSGVDNCGAMGNACGNLAGWVSGNCSNIGQCVATSCDTGYHLTSGKCVADTNTCCGVLCTTCTGGAVCNAGSCQLTCTTPLTECSGACVNTTQNPAHCGQCNTQCNAASVSNATQFYCDEGACKASACAAGYFVHNGACVSSGVDNCGAMGNACGNLAGWGNGSCLAGKCEASDCEGGYHLTSGKCVADTNTCCGEACTACTGSEVCNAGSCQLTCTAPLTECSGACVNTTQNPAHCGGCNTQCNATLVSNATQFYCDGGNCKAKACLPGYFVHEGACVLSDVSNCGFWGNQCSVANAENHCTNGLCTYNCNTDFHRTATGGCEADSLSNCGATHYACANLPGWLSGTCTSGVCEAETCATGFHVNAKNCVLDTDTECGDAMLNCSTGAGVNQAGTCVSGSCTFACNPGYADCDAELGCETAGSC